MPLHVASLESGLRALLAWRGQRLASCCRTLYQRHVLLDLGSGVRGDIVQKAMGIFDRVFGVNCSVRLARSYRQAYLLAFLLLLTPNSALAQAGVNSGASWSQYKSQCGIPASSAYND